MGAPTITAMALTVGDRAVRPLTADEVLRMVEVGILHEDDPVELLHGVLTVVSAKSPAHETVKMRLNRWLTVGTATSGCEVRVEGCLIVPDRTSLPEPDLMVTGPHNDPRHHPTTALLVIEVAVSSLRTDTRIKPPLYAAAGVPELWVVEPDARRVRLFGDPRDGGYATESKAGPVGMVRPRAVEIAPLDLAELFAGL
jgi:Uma2 family endonuclease